MSHIKHWLLPLSIFMILLTGCQTVKFVQPYDEQLINGTEAFYQSAATFLNKGAEVSPEQRPQAEDSEHPAHADAMQAGYDGLVIEANTLLLRAMVNSQEVDRLGQKVQGEINSFIDEKIPSVCAGNQAILDPQFASLTVGNFTDLKCLVTNWHKQHQQAPGKVLTKNEWQRRHRALFAMILDIQKAENFKKSSDQ